MVAERAHGVNLLHAVGAELDVRRKVRHALVLVQRRVDVGGLDDVLLALRSLEQGLGEARTGHGHGEGSGTGTALCLHNLITTELHALDVVVTLCALEIVASLAQHRYDGCAGVATNDQDVLVGGVGALKLADEAAGAHDVECGDTEQLLGVVDAGSLEDLGGDCDGAVDGVGNDQDGGVGAVLGSCLGEVADDGCVGVEEVLEWLAGGTTSD